MNHEHKMKRRYMLGMGTAEMNEKVPRSPLCVVCQSPKIHYRVNANGYCKAHRAEAVKLQTSVHLHRVVAREQMYDMTAYKYDHAMKNHVVIAHPKKYK